MTMTPDSALDARLRRTVVWVVSLATVGLIFDGYDLVAYGAVVSTFLRDASQIGTVTPATAGTLGSYALVGALLAGSVGDILESGKDSSLCRILHKPDHVGLWIMSDQFGE